MKLTWGLQSWTLGIVHNCSWPIVPKLRRWLLSQRCGIGVEVCGCYYVSFTCSPTSTDEISTMEVVVHEQIHDEESTKIGLKIRPSLIESCRLLEVHACWFPNWKHKVTSLVFTALLMEFSVICVIIVSFTLF
jgi:hypothetical protein